MIVLTIENSSLETMFNEKKSEALGYFRKELKNYNIDVKIVINKNLSTKVAYTPQEKYTKMADKNPNLETLRKNLNLEIGYA